MFGGGRIHSSKNKNNNNNNNMDSQISKPRIRRQRRGRDEEDDDVSDPISRCCDDGLSSVSLPIYMNRRRLLPVQRIATFAIVAVSLFGSSSSSAAAAAAFSHRPTTRSLGTIRWTRRDGIMRTETKMRTRRRRIERGLESSYTSVEIPFTRLFPFELFSTDGSDIDAVPSSSSLSTGRTVTTSAAEISSRSRPTPKKATATRSGSSPLEQSFRQIRQHVIEELRTTNNNNNNNIDDDDERFETCSVLIMSMVDYLRDISTTTTTTTPTGNATVNAETSSSESSTPSSRSNLLQEEDRRIVSEIIDETMQAFFARAFAAPYRGTHAWNRITLGVELLQLQLSSSGLLAEPYDTVPKAVLVRTLQAVTGLLEGPPPQHYGRHRQQRRRRRQPDGIRKNNRPLLVRNKQNDDRDSGQKSELNPDVAFRLLQRLVTGVGMRNYPKKMTSSRLAIDDHNYNINDDETDERRPQKVPMAAQLYEVDFNRVLNVYSNLGKMDMAHRVIALQERTPHAPSLSPVTYSILLKGYGKLGDWYNIDMLIRHGAASGVKPDTILFNSLMDAYISCGQIEKAQAVFNVMKKPSRRRNEKEEMIQEDAVNYELSVDDSVSDFPFSSEDCPVADLRSYNILLKGLARQGSWKEAQDVATEMDENNMWDHVTTNTLVLAACNAKKYKRAEELLAEKTTNLDVGATMMKLNDGKNRSRSKKGRQHPNADAYTSLMNSYGNEGQVEKALTLLRSMKDRGVEANEFHYSCLVGSLARKRQVDKASKMISYVRTIPSIRDHPVIYNSFISGLVHHSASAGDDNMMNIIDDDYDKYVDEAVGVLRTMIKRQIYLDVSTVAVIIDGFGRCLHPRVVEATTLVEKLESERLIPRNHIKVYTALIRVFANANDLQGAIQTFRKISQPDVPAVNALLEACARCGNSEVLTETFLYYFDQRDRDERRQKRVPSASSVLEPDVISYTTMIRDALARDTPEGYREARRLYEEMKYQRRIFPDTILVNIIIRGLVEAARSGWGAVQPTDARFAAGVLRDAEQLHWDEGQLERRKRVTELAMRNCVGNVWDEEAGLYGLWKDHPRSKSSPSTPIEQQRRRQKDEEDDEENEMFERHGWNQVDSGFQLWGAGKSVMPPPSSSSAKSPGERETDKFLQSKGWNDMESGFRII